MENITIADLNYNDSLSDILSNYITQDNICDYTTDISSDQVIDGHKVFSSKITVGSGNNNVGSNCLAVGNDLTVGSYNWYYKGIILDEDTNSAQIFLCPEQPRFPYPFLVKKHEYDAGSTKCHIAALNANAKRFEITNFSTYANLSTHYKNWWTLRVNLDTVKRADYSQLCVDLGPNYYQTATNEEISSKMLEYYTDAFTPDTSLSIYGIQNVRALTADGKNEITITNNDRVDYMRCGKVTEIDSYGAVLNVTNLADAAFRRLKQGINFFRLDDDDFSLTFVDNPTLSGPANAATYSSICVGDNNKVLRRSSWVTGTENITEGDYCVAIGKNAYAKHYASFVWSPRQQEDTNLDQRYVESKDAYTFTIGLKDTIAKSKQRADYRTLFVGDCEGNHEELHKFMWGCISSDNALKAEIKAWLGLA